MSDYIEAIKVGDLREGTMKKVHAGERELLIALVGGRYFCADSKCPHLGGDLSRGTLNGTVLTCPLHGSQFDLDGGRMVRWTDWSGLKLGLAKTLKPPHGIRIYETRVDGDRVMVARG
jgi:3-phenylpropionate/trans-cinnamate dioxygenase ferredoxin component